MEQENLVVGIAGASGIVYGTTLLQVLRDTPIQTHLVMSKSAEMTLSYEMAMSLKEVQTMADEVYAVKNVGAAIASGSFPTCGMVIAPCSIRSMSEIASGVTSSLLTRAADVTLKERRKLVLMVRETPFHTGHLRTMTQLSEMGAIIAPPLPAFYNRPQTVEDIVLHSVGRVLDLLDIKNDIVKRWGLES